MNASLPLVTENFCLISHVGFSAFVDIPHLITNLKNFPYAGLVTEK
jgi:hypothetical protein